MKAETKAEISHYIDTIAAAFPSPEKVLRAAFKFLRRKHRIEHPDGKFDNGGRWYPAHSEPLDTGCFRSPSRRFKYSYLTACRSARHCAVIEHCADVTLVRRIALRIEKSESIEQAIEAVRSALSAARRAKRKARAMLAASTPPAIASRPVADPGIDLCEEK
ncbi:MAG TPA: hypothetical protein PKJ41_17010 [Bryobacteraceae bacterium]|nr:hypothetical protein [Bryobacteraceae bacterium]